MAPSPSDKCLCLETGGRASSVDAPFHAPFLLSRQYGERPAGPARIQLDTLRIYWETLLTISRHIGENLDLDNNASPNWLASKTRLPAKTAQRATLICILFASVEKSLA